MQDSPKWYGLGRDATISAQPFLLAKIKNHTPGKKAQPTKEPNRKNDLIVFR